MRCFHPNGVCLLSNLYQIHRTCIDERTVRQVSFCLLNASYDCDVRQAGKMALMFEPIDDSGLSTAEC